MIVVGITKATPSMMTHLGWGTFLLYAVLTYIGFVFVYFCMPEFKGEPPSQSQLQLSLRLGH